MTRAEVSQRWRLKHPEKAKASQVAYRHSEKGRATEKAARIRSRTSGSWRTAQLKYLYGITEVDYDRMHAEQNGLCAICSGPPTGMRNRLVVDHDHATGKVRALLCDLCNTAIGKLREDSVLIRKAAEYLEAHI